MNIGILITATGETYRRLALELFKSFDLFLPNHEKKVICFSDVPLHASIPVYHVPTEHLPTPLNALLRYTYFKRVRIDPFDVLYSIDADCKVVAPIGDEILPDRKGQMVATQHFWQCEKSELFETNSKSTAFVPDNSTHYFQGCFYDGFSEDFFHMADACSMNVRQDLDNRIIAKWWDESHLNRYFVDHPPKELSMAYCFPGRETKPPNVVPKIIHYNYHGV